MWGKDRVEAILQVQRTLVFAGLVLALAALAPGQRGPRSGFRGGSRAETLPKGNSEAEQKVLAAIDQAQRDGTMFQNVPSSDGRMLRLLAETSGAKNVVEIGTSTGISGMWLCLGLEKTGGHLNTFEYDSGRAATARRHFQAAGVEGMVTLVEGDAHQTLSRVKGPIDMVFIDADKEGYVDYLHKLLPLLRPGGLILAHNIGMAPDYDQLVNNDPALDTVYFSVGEGMAITLKKR